MCAPTPRLPGSSASSAPVTRPSWWRAASTGACRAPTYSRSRRTSTSRRAPDRAQRRPPSRRLMPQPVGAARWTRFGADRVPRRRCGQFGVDQQRRRFVLQRLESADWSAELLTSADVLGRGVGATAHCSGGCARRQRHHNATGPLGRDSGYHRGVRHDVVGEFQAHPHRCTGRCLLAVRSSGPGPVSRQRTIARRHPRYGPAAEFVALQRFPTPSPTIR